MQLRKAEWAKVTSEEAEGREELGGEVGKENPHLSLFNIHRQAAHTRYDREEMSESTPRGENIGTRKCKVITVPEWEGAEGTKF